jgi:GNAT superfamily N-acetyltransferase
VLDVFRGLSDRSRRLRFHGPKEELRDADLQQLVDVGCCGREAVAAVELSTGRSVGVARFVREPGSAEAEIAFAVVDEWQGRGIGRALLRELAELGTREGIERFRASVVPGNDAALSLVRGVGSVASSRFVDGVVELVVDLPRDVQASAHADRGGLPEGPQDLGAERRDNEADR